MKIAHVIASAPPVGTTRESWAAWREAETARMHAELLRQLCEYLAALEERAELAADGEPLH